MDKNSFKVLNDNSNIFEEEIVTLSLLLLFTKCLFKSHLKIYAGAVVSMLPYKMQMCLISCSKEIIKLQKGRK